MGSKAGKGPGGKPFETYLSKHTDGGKLVWSAIHKGLPLCAETTRERAEATFRQFKLKPLAIWDGDRGQWSLQAIEEPNQSKLKTRTFDGREYEQYARFGAYGAGNKEQGQKDAGALVLQLRKEGRLARKTLETQEYGIWWVVWRGPPGKVEMTRGRR
jgi:hypothetical protein